MTTGSNVGSYYQQAQEALDKGLDPVETVLGDDNSATKSPTGINEEDTRSVEAQTDVYDDLLSQGSNSEQESTDSEPSTEPTEDSQEEAEPTSDIEEYKVKGADGRSKKIKVDYNDRKAIKERALRAHGANVWKSKMDKEIRERKELSSKFNELQKNFNELDSAYQSGGVKGLVDRLDGEGSFEVLKQQIIDQHELRKNATQEELALLDAQEESASRDKELEKLRAEMADFKEKTASDREAAEFSELTAIVTPIFSKFRFEGKLGNERQEQRMDKALWDEVIEQLGEVQDSEVDITPQLVRKAFRKVSKEMREDWNIQGDKRAKKVVAKKKQEATEHAQKKVIQGVNSNRSAEALREAVRTGSISGVLGKFWNGN